MTPQKLVEEALLAAEVGGDDQTIAYVTVAAAVTQALVALTAEIHAQNQLLGRTRIVIAAWSSINGFDAGAAAAALIAPGAVVAPCGFGGALALRLNLLVRLDRDVADIEQAYNTALLEAAK